MKKRNICYAILLAIALWLFCNTTALAIANEDTKEPVPEVIVEINKTHDEELEPIELTDNDMYLLTQIAYAEARGEGVDGMLIVMNVIQNRVNDSRFPSTISGVVSQPNQFTTYRLVGSMSPSEECYKALTLFMKGNDISCGALGFRPTRSSCTWAQHLFDLGGHSFYIW